MQGGCIWHDVDEAAAYHVLAMVDDPVNHTGVGGLTLRVYERLSGRYWLTASNLLQVHIVLSGGSTKAVSKDEDPELFWAVRGAGHCFELVSEFLFQTYD